MSSAATVSSGTEMAAAGRGVEDAGSPSGTDATDVVASLDSVDTEEAEGVIAEERLMNENVEGGGDATSFTVRTSRRHVDAGFRNNNSDPRTAQVLETAHQPLPRQTCL